LIDRQLYLPKDWTGDPKRLAAAHVPENVKFATKPHLAVEMVERAVGAGVPFAWVAADSVYGVGEVEMALRRAGKGYVLGVASSAQFNSWDKPEPVSGTAEAIALALPASRWVRLPAGAGTKGPRLYDWGYVELADLDARSFFGCRSAQTTWTRGLLIRRGLSDGKMAFFTTWCPTGTPLEVLVGVEGRRWAIEDAFETAKTELGLDHNETRSWHGWHRHVSLVMLAFAMLMVIRHKADTLTSPQKRPPTRQRNPWCDGHSRKSVVLPGV
jgi:SRSO17 transposase